MRTRLLVVAALLAGGLRAAGAPTPADRAVVAAEARLAGGGAAAHAALALAFLAKARESGDTGYHPRAAAAVARALALEPAALDAARAQAAVLLAAHDFAGARAVAARALQRAPSDWRTLGLLTDALVELGAYPEAVDAAERMAALHPGAAAYARIAWLRALHGDRPGARDALGLALRATGSGDAEGRAWLLVHLGHERFATGALDDAAAAHVAALRAFPDHPLALPALARVRAAQGRLDTAAALLGRALERAPGLDVAADLAAVCAAAGDATGARAAWRLAARLVRLARATGSLDAAQVARVWAERGRHPAAALGLARHAARGRDDVFTADTLAWALYRNGRLPEAKRAAARALRLGTPEAAFHYHAGMIARALGRPAAARRHLARALALNPYFDLDAAPRARAVLAALDPTPARELVSQPPDRASGADWLAACRLARRGDRP
jgi:tetratricopeptide (TPR) repeat protein